ncbi:MAG TPA: hypothetical protein VGN61_04145 [Verrucomicrobiae bacterium]|jgi:hypothetical protein
MTSIKFIVKLSGFSPLKFFPNSRRFWTTSEGDATKFDTEAEAAQQAANSGVFSYSIEPVQITVKTKEYNEQKNETRT